ncbi:MAG: AAA family ATPase [Actinomycetota bacterium]|nr:AAA family ATPase [Actinomycetota bacterium]
MAAPSQPGEGVGLQHYLQVVRRRFPIIVTVTALVLAVSLGMSLRQETIYGASSEVIVNRDNLASTLTRSQVPYIDAQTAERLMETQVQLARVPALASRVIAANRLSDTPQRFLEMSSVTVAPKTDILIFTARRPSPALARQLATSYANEFTKYSAERDRAQLEVVASGVRDQLAQMNTPEARRTPLYNELEGRLGQLQTILALQSPTAEVVRDAEIARKLQPRPLTAGVGGVLLGLLLGTALAFLRDSLDTRVRSSDEVAELLGQPLLGRLPEPPERLGKERKLILIEDPEAEDAEPFHFLRSTIAFANLSVEAQVIMVTSALEGEGKSTTVANLAVALAAAGSRVVVVDADTRRPTLDRFFRIPRSPGVNDIALTGTAPAQALVKVLAPQPQTRRVTTTEGSTVAATHASLEVLPAGRSGHGVDVDTLAEMLHALRGGADIILVDAPPMLQVGDAAALSARVDALLIVARLNVVRRPMLEELRRILESTPTPTLGFVLTGAAEEGGYGGYYRHKYGPSTDRAEETEESVAPSPTRAESPLPSPTTTLAPTPPAGPGRDYDASGTGSGSGESGLPQADQAPPLVRAGPVLVPPVDLLVPSRALVGLQRLLSLIQDIDRALNDHVASHRVGTVKLLNLVALGLEAGSTVPPRQTADGDFVRSEAVVGDRL